MHLDDARSVTDPVTKIHSMPGWLAGPGGGATAASRHAAYRVYGPGGIVVLGTRPRSGHCESGCATRGYSRCRRPRDGCARPDRTTLHCVSEPPIAGWQSRSGRQGKQAGEVRVPGAVSDLVGAGTGDDSAASGAHGSAVSQHVGRRERGEPSSRFVLCHARPPPDRSLVKACDRDHGAR